MLVIAHKTPVLNSFYPKVDTWATRQIAADQGPYGTGKGSGAVFDAGGDWLERQRKAGARMQVEQW